MIDVGCKVVGNRGLGTGMEALSVCLEMGEFCFEFNCKFGEFSDSFIKKFWQMYVIRGDSQGIGCLK
jgi:hypothetical protein